MKLNYFLILLFLVAGCTQIQPRRPINPKPSTTIYKQAIEENKKLNKIEEEKILALIARDSTKNYIQSSEGYWYTYINKVNDSLVQPKSGDEVVLNYNVTDLNDVIIYSKEQIGEKTYVVDKEDIISGLQKGIKLMKMGETITFVIPSYNAYGITGDGNKIGLNQSIKSTVTLINIK